jgi:hypothetical protein
MTEILQGDCGKTIIGLVTIVTLFGGPCILGGWVLWLHHRKNEHIVDLKQEMLERGMSADEIVRVLDAEQPLKKSARTSSKLSPSDRTDA